MSTYMSIAQKAAYAAGKFLKKREDLKVDNDSSHDIKLASDKKSEQIIIDVLHQTGIDILSEERGLIKGLNSSDLKWVVDPLDGSINFLKGLPELSCISIALFNQGMPLLGVIYRYAGDEMFAGGVGKQATLNGEAIRASGVKKVRDAVLATGFASSRDYSDKSLLSYVSYAKNFKKVRMLGSSAVMGCCVACGRVDAYIEDDIRLWDVASLMPIIDGAGGVFTINHKNDYTCDFRAFASQELKDDFLCIKQNG